VEFQLKGVVVSPAAPTAQLVVRWVTISGLVSTTQANSASYHQQGRK